MLHDLNNAQNQRLYDVCILYTITHSALCHRCFTYILMQNVFRVRRSVSINTYMYYVYWATSMKDGTVHECMHVQFAG